MRAGTASTWPRTTRARRRSFRYRATSGHGGPAVAPQGPCHGGGGVFGGGGVCLAHRRPIDLFVDYGRGFHSNDARTLLLGQATTLLATATGYEVGTTVRPIPGLSVSATGFLIDLGVGAIPRRRHRVDSGVWGATRAGTASRSRGVTTSTSDCMPMRLSPPRTRDSPTRRMSPRARSSCPTRPSGPSAPAWAAGDLGRSRDADRMDR